MADLIAISTKEYGLIKTLVYDKFGINLGDQKQSLVIGRLQKVLRQNGFENFNQYYDFILTDKSGKGLNTLINRISTNHTYFNREHAHFDFYSQVVLPEWRHRANQTKDKSYRLWSAGCSSGEETYMLSMLLLEYFGKEAASLDLGILGTDISEQALSKAQVGIYSDENIAKLPAALKHKYFRKNADGSWVADIRIKKQILYRRLNLMRTSFPFRKKFHTIFCRNVMIYFDLETREQLVHRFYQNMESGGYLFIGHSESLGRANSYFSYVRPAVYKKIGS